MGYDERLVIQTKYVPPSFSACLMASDINTLKATNRQRSMWQNSMSFSSGVVPSTLRDKLKPFLDSEPDLK